MIIVYLSSRGDVYYRCSKCEHTGMVPVELKTQVFWDHYNGIQILQMIQHYLDQHSSKQQYVPVNETSQWPALP